ncbi:MFS transporter [Gellertiella hungarica]|uniref:PPP family 3-phenylpropionic acid transporter n=1 Tax=Gellertiella hungarica TaxID=1572859 RepID=A0A7W6J612_9HYPH|nr:MFS transporter [Gellertiella hungarica]MBB4064593.1 PPP family 3-phenylpropionic acid transporter [Gellertiella hungarica]
MSAHTLHPEAPPPWYRTRSSLVFCSPMIVNGMALPFFSVYLKSLGFSDYEIGVIQGVPLIVRVLVMPVAAMIADRLPDRAWVLIASALLSLATALGLFGAAGFLPVLLLYTLQGAVYSPYVPVAESLFLTGVRRWGYDYGSMRLWGSVAFIFSTLAGGYAIQAWGGGVVLYGMVFGFFLMVMMGLAAPRTGRSERPKSDVRPAPRTLRRIDLQLAMIGVSVVQSSHAILYTFASIHWIQLGFTGSSIAFLWATGVLAEILTFVFSKRLYVRFSAWTLMGIGASAALVRWVLFPLPEDYVSFLFLQSMHALTFGFCHIGIQRLIVETVGGEQEASAQGTYYFYNGSFLAVVTFVSGYLNVAFGVHAYTIMAFVVLAGVAIAAFGRARRPAAAGIPATGG